jgi:hypothetical protein
MFFILIRKDGLYLAETGWTPFAKFARQFCAETAGPALRAHQDCAAWRIEGGSGYAPERMCNRPDFRAVAA